MDTRSDEGGTARLGQLCACYFGFYAVFGVLAKGFTTPTVGFPAMNDVEFLAYSTLGGNLICLAVLIAFRWYRLSSTRHVQLGRLRFPHEFLYIVPSGFCTAVVIPTTTLLYLLLPSVMVAMVTMRASIIVVGRLVDAIQIRQGILTKKVYVQEEIAIGFALVAVSVQLFSGKGGGGELLGNKAALLVLASYVLAYLARIYIMNYFKNTRPAGARLDNQGFFAIEQIAAFAALLLASAAVFCAPSLVDRAASLEPVRIFRASIVAPRPGAGWAVLAGTVYGMVAFFSVFIFMFKGRTATFAGLVNRLTSLVAGTTATLVYAAAFGGKLPRPEDWLALGFILVAVAFLAAAERRRANGRAAPAASPVPVNGVPVPTA